MAYQHSDICTKVLLRVRDEGFSTTQVTDYLNDTINDIYNEYRLPFMQASETYTLTPGEADITDHVGLPANYSQALNLINTTDGSEKIIPYKDVDSADTVNPDQDDTSLYPNGTPEYWYFYEDTIRLFPAPASDYTVKLRYYKNPTMLDGDDDVPELPAQYEEILVMGAGYRILQVKDNYDQAAILKNKYDEILDKLVYRSSQTQVGAPKIMKTARRHVGKVSF